MNRDAVVYGLSVVAIAAGLASLLTGEAVGNSSAIVIGGVVVVLGVCGLTGYTAMLDG